MTSDESDMTQTSHEGKSLSRVTSPESKQSSKRELLLEDDFFSLSGSFEKRKKKKHKHKHHDGAIAATAIGKDVATANGKDASPAIGKDVATAIGKDAATAIGKDVSPVTTSQEDFKSAMSSFNDAPLQTSTLDEPPTSQGPILEESSDTGPALKESSQVLLIDKQKILKEIALKIKAAEENNHLGHPALDDSDEDDYKPKEQNIQIQNKPFSTNSYTFDIANEKKRKYIIRVSSKLPVLNNSPVQVDLGCKGTKSFGKILNAALDFFKKTYANQLSPVLLDRYDATKSALVWVEGRTVIHSFFTPRTLRIPLPGGMFNPLLDKVENITPTLLHVFLIPKDNASNFLNVYPEFMTHSVEPVANELTETQVEEAEADAENISSEDEDISEMAIPLPETISIDDNDNVFAVGLKGKDNKRIMCNVTPETKLKNLLLFYLKTKGIDAASIDMSHAKLIFDDEEMNLDDTVGNTELEEDFEIQIVL
ncbi:ESC2 [Candida oxycetoniae]|uniref:ESC2 n=1 Tax=Candida oxycetoniae TaxID=497107 RepID=A0AAI9WVZ7_9ASCO|nr:ESC2 [Candida oxycetoniae]KAI3402676.2 ESC2 [Candida oxycetoniae]